MISKAVGPACTRDWPTPNNQNPTALLAAEGREKSYAFAAAFALGAHFAYYVTFVQFALLHYLSQNFGLTPASLGAPLGCLTVCGIAGSLAAGSISDRFKPSTGMCFFAISILSIALGLLAFAALRFADAGRLISLFSLLGVLLSAQIVLLLGALTHLAPKGKIGVLAGASAGGAYLAANLIAGFAPDPTAVAFLDGLLVLSVPVVIYVTRFSLKLTWFGITGESRPSGSGSSNVAQPPSAVHEGMTGEGACPTLSSMAAALLPLALLVAVDSFTFYPVGLPAPMPHPVFATHFAWVQNGILHLAFAVAAGLAYNRIGHRNLTAISAFFMICAALALLANLRMDLVWLVRVFYSAVVGTYTVVFFSAFSDLAPKDRPMTGIAVGIVLIGWLANPLGIAAEQLLEARTNLNIVFSVAVLGGILIFRLTIKAKN